MSRGKHKSKPTTSRRAERQKLKDKYAHAREDAQLAGIIPTTPEEALTNERTHSVDPLEGLPEYVKQALKENWSTPGSAKPAVIAALLRPFFNDIEMIDKEGNLINVKASPKLLNELAKTLAALDQRQYERDNPEAAGKAKGGGNSMSVNMNVMAANVVRGMIERGELEPEGSVSDVPASLESRTSGSGGLTREVEDAGTHTSDEQGACESVENGQQPHSD